MDDGNYDDDGDYEDDEDNDDDDDEDYFDEDEGYDDNPLGDGDNDEEASKDDEVSSDDEEDTRDDDDEDEVEEPNEIKTEVVMLRDHHPMRFRRGVTLPTANILQNIGGPRLSGVHPPKNKIYSAGGTKRRDSRRMPSHAQVRRLIGQAIPLCSLDQFNSAFEEAMVLFSKNKNVLPLRDEDKVCATPIIWIDYALRKAFGSDSVELQYAMPSPFVGTSSFASHHALGCGFNFVILDCILQRRLPLRNKGKYSNIPPTPLVYDESELDVSSDYKYRTCIMVLPEPGVFFSVHHRRTSKNGVDRSFIANDISWIYQLIIT